MSRELIYLPAASQDFVEGKDYYEELSSGAGGQRFENAFKEAIRQVKDGLVTHAVAFEQFHRVNLRKFPYALYYRLVGEKALIVAVLYSRWHPKRIQRGLESRSV
jgi:toxin ParE1/3/4